MRRLQTLSVPVALGLLALLAAAPALAQVNATIAVNQGRLQGTHPSGDILIYTPDPVQPGSSISHWDPSAFPNLLMEPAITPDLPFLGLDISPQQLEDIGWSAGTATINIFPLDPPGVGFTDPRPFAGAPGNPATTLGEARVNLFNAVLGAWANTIDSDVDIDVLVLWIPLPCVAGAGAVLAAAGPTFIFADDEGVLPVQNTWYHAALAEALAGQDLTGPVAEGGGDIIVLVNPDIDNECLGPGTGWYYGLDGNNPPNLVDQAPTVLHEIDHGLGMSSFTDDETGEEILELPSIYDLFVFDTDLGMTWDQMTDAERVASAINVRGVVWNGPLTNAAAGALLEPGVPELVVTSPPSAAGTYDIGTATFGPPLPEAGLSGQIACLRDGVADVTLLNGCTPAVNPAQLAGRIALIDRGACTFTSKVANAQAAGAIAAIIVNNAGNTPITLGGSDPSITIPTISVGRTDGNRIRQAACADAASFLNDDRFQVSAQWATADASGPARAVSLTDDSSYFYFFDADNVELVVKVLDACELPEFNNFWVFAAGLTNVEVTLTVVDTQTGQSKTYMSPLDTPFQPIQDTRAFATCP